MQHLCLLCNAWCKLISADKFIPSMSQGLKIAPPVDGMLIEGSCLEWLQRLHPHTLLQGTVSKSFKITWKRPKKDLCSCSLASEHIHIWWNVLKNVTYFSWPAWKTWRRFAALCRPCKRSQWRRESGRGSCSSWELKPWGTHVAAERSQDIGRKIKLQLDEKALILCINSRTPTVNWRHVSRS